VLVIDQLLFSFSFSTGSLSLLLLYLSDIIFIVSLMYNDLLPLHTHVAFDTPVHSIYVRFLIVRKPYVLSELLPITSNI
jgi:hypothetical protein